MKKEKNNNTNLPFILVKDMVLAERLVQNGFVCVSQTEDTCTFINNGKLVFDGGLDGHQVVFTRMLHF